MDGRKATVEPPAPGAGVALLDRHNFVVRGRRLACEDDKRLDRPMHGLVSLLS
jgi:hypothetical protein